jgi:hypothetical protein
MRNFLFSFTHAAFPALLLSQEAAQEAAPSSTPVLPDRYVGAVVAAMFLIGALALTWKLRKWLHRRSLRKSTQIYR